MPLTQIPCPNCKQPAQANVEQLFDVTADPAAKQRLLGGGSNIIQCPNCGFQGQIATPIVYHDTDKELLLTYFPSEMGMPINEQEKMVGPLIKKITDNLPMEKRKGYLLNPQSHLTYQSLLERILNADGITPEMIKAQQDRINLMQKLTQASGPDVRAEIIKQNTTLIDEQFFAIFNRLLESAIAAGQQQTAEQMAEIQKELMEQTEFGQKLQASVEEIEAAAQSLKDIGNDLTREKLLELLIEAPTKERRRAIVSMTRPGLDYTFFQNLSEQIDKAADKEKENLERLREELLKYVDQIDHQLEEHYQTIQQFIETLISQKDIKKATQDNLQGFSQETIEVLNSMLHQASENKDEERLARLKQIVLVLQEAMQPPEEVALIEQFLDAPDEAAMEKMVEEQADKINQSFMEILGRLVTQIESQKQPEEAAEEDKATAERLQVLYKAALTISMKKNI